jgi:hypothetical protein
MWEGVKRQSIIPFPLAAVTQNGIDEGGNKKMFFKRPKILSRLKAAGGIKNKHAFVLNQTNVRLSFVRFPEDHCPK